MSSWSLTWPLDCGGTQGACVLRSWAYGMRDHGLHGDIGPELSQPTAHNPHLPGPCMAHPQCRLDAAIRERHALVDKVHCRLRGLDPKPLQISGRILSSDMLWQDLEALGVVRGPDLDPEHRFIVSSHAVGASARDAVNDVKLRRVWVPV